MKMKKILFYSILLTSFGSYASNGTEANIAEYKSINDKINNKLTTQQESQRLFEICSGNGNTLCSSFLESAYFIAKNYSAAYPFLIKSQGVIHLYNTNTAPSELYLGAMFDNGLGVLQNKDKAIEHYKICASVGDGICAYNIAAIYSNKAVINKKVVDPNDDGLIQSYAWMKVSQALGIKEFIPSNGRKQDMTFHLEGMQIILGAKKTQKADKLASQICSTIPSCIQ